jgi:hypothetical protein
LFEALRPSERPRVREHNSKCMKAKGEGPHDSLRHTQPLNLIGPQQHAQHCHSQSKPPPRTPHPGPTRTPSTAPKLANGSPAAAAARLGVVEVGALESGLRVDLHPSVVGDACRVCACRGLDRWGACEGEARLQER